MQQWTIILNPWAGKGAAGAQRGALEAALGAAGVPYTILTTHAQGGATELAWQAIAAGATHVVAAGGDGTLNEIVNGIKGAEAEHGQRVPLGIIPIGTGNDFIKSLDGFDAGDITGAIRRIVEGRTRRVDLGRVEVAGYEPRYFLNGLGVGLDAQIAFEARQITNLKGTAVYLLAIIRALAKYRAAPMQVQHDGRSIRRRLMFATVGNGRCEGSGFYVTPEAQIDDGLLDLCLINTMRLDEIIRYIPRVMDGTHTKIKHVTMGRTAEVQIACGQGLPVAVDGEVISISAREIRAAVLPAALEIFF
ncbi:diacylglycerol kinase family lipid kinase [Chloroflexia bacterium SDU3-3]|nr:diacylglycerol kinase family lipid kinase [Chloroflexia bacterium SDU3-3]